MSVSFKKFLLHLAFFCFASWGDSSASYCFGFHCPQQFRCPSIFDRTNFQNRHHIKSYVSTNENEPTSQTSQIPHPNAPTKRKPSVKLRQLRRPPRPAIAQKKLAERQALLQSRHNEALQDPTLLTNLSFSDCNSLHPSSKRALIERMGLQTMTEVQAQTFSAALAGRDILARARTGTGKTLAFLIPVVERILNNPVFVPGKSVGCLVVAPTRELAIQIGDEAEKLLGFHSELRVHVMYGGTKMARDRNGLSRGLPAILVATPGRLLDHLKETKVRGRKFGDDILGATEIVVLDEIDRLLDMGFRREIQKILSYLPRKEKRQTMLFSATIPKGLKGIMKESLREDFVEVDCVKDGAKSAPTNMRVSQSHVILSNMEDVIPSLYTILKQATASKPHKIVVFFPTARMVSFFADFFNEGMDIPVIELHSKKSQSARNTASEKFRNARSAVLFTSDVSSRGIDYPDVTHVIQIGIPESREQYIHRLGRTARAGKEGIGLLVLFPFESGFLSELKGLDVPCDKTLSKLCSGMPKSEMPQWMVQGFERIQSGGNKLASSAQLAYLAFLGYYLGQMDRTQLKSKENVVQISNDFSKAVGLAHVPAIEQKLISKMELKGVQGVVVEEED